jgi:D-3-phosphoglycerate dehydrogenase
VVAGTLGADKSSRLVRWGRYELDAQLQGVNLVIKNTDRPGVIGAVGTLLGESNVNVSRMQMGLDAATKEAASVWALDSTPSAETVARIDSHAAVTRAVCVTVD